MNLETTNVSAPKPIEIARENGDSLKIAWSDGKQQSIKLLQLRFACHCAVCRESQLPPSYQMPFIEKMTGVKNLEAVGNYALGILWMDGHRSILPYERIRNLKGSHES